mgnify:CR=1 FL=1
MVVGPAEEPGTTVGPLIDRESVERVERYVALADDLVRAAVRDLLRRRSGGPELLAYKEGRRWHDVSSADINEYVRGRSAMSSPPRTSAPGTAR